MLCNLPPQIQLANLGGRLSKAYYIISLTSFSGVGWVKTQHWSLSIGSVAFDDQPIAIFSWKIIRAATGTGQEFPNAKPYCLSLSSPGSQSDHPMMAAFSSPKGFARGLVGYPWFNGGRFNEYPGFLPSSLNMKKLKRFMMMIGTFQFFQYQHCKKHSFKFMNRRSKSYRHHRGHGSSTVNLDGITGLLKLN